LLGIKGYGISYWGIKWVLLSTNHIVDRFLHITQDFVTWILQTFLAHPAKSCGLTKSHPYQSSLSREGFLAGQTLYLTQRFEDCCQLTCATATLPDSVHAYVGGWTCSSWVSVVRYAGHRGSAQAYLVVQGNKYYFAFNANQTYNDDNLVFIYLNKLILLLLRCSRKLNHYL